MEKKSSAPVNLRPEPFYRETPERCHGHSALLRRLRLQGSLRYLYCAKIFEEYLSQAKVLCKDFKKFATGLTDEVCERAERLAQSLKRPFTYLSSSALSKEELARKIAERDGIKEGLVAIFRCVEPCRTYKLGLLHLRLQTWFPFLIHICLNGHDWLARQMDEKGLRYRKLYRLRGNVPKISLC